MSSVLTTCPHAPANTGDALPRAGVRRRAWLSGCGLAVLAPLVARAAPGASPPKRQPWPAQRTVPALQLPTLAGGDWTLAEQRGQVLLLNFWASWCEPCRDEMPALQALAQRHASQGLRVATVNFKETPATIRQFTERVPLALPILLDREGEVAKAWGVRLFPTSLLLGRDGRVRWTVQGEVDWLSPPALSWITELL